MGNEMSGKTRYLMTKTILLMVFFISSLSLSANLLRDELVKAADVKTSGKFVRARFLAAIKEPINLQADKKALIIGDSHAQDFFNSVLENDYLNDYQLSARSIPTRCQVYLGDNLSEYVAEKDEFFCEKSDSLKKAMEQIRDMDLVILVANWTEWSATKLSKTIENMQLQDEQKLFVIGRKSFGKMAIRKYLRMSKSKLQALRNKPDHEQAKISEIMNKTLNKEMFIDLQELACDDDNTCPLFTDSMRLISFDGSHLTKDGAQYIGKLIFQNSLLGEL